MVAVPLVFMAAGTVVALVTVLATDLVLGPLARVAPQIPATVALHLLTANLLGLLAAEASAAEPPPPGSCSSSAYRSSAS